MDSIYIDIEEAADLIRPRRKKGDNLYATRLCRYQIQEKHITPIHPELAIICPDSGKVLQVLGKSEKPFFLREEVEAYVEQKKVNMQRGPQRQVIATDCETGAKKEYESVAKTAEALELPYHIVYTAIFNKMKRFSEKSNKHFTFEYK